jgi:NB-ARC domain
MSQPQTRNRRPTLLLSEQGQRMIEEARHRKGWTVSDERWLRAAHQLCNEEPKNGWADFWQKNESTSPSAITLKRFRRGMRYINRRFFVALCTAVGVELDDLADLDRPVADLQYPSVIGDFPTELADSPFYGRASAIAQLTGWMGDCTSRLIWVHGRAGMGKTTLGCRAVRQVGSQFDFLIWLSLESSPPLSEVLSQLLPYFSDQTDQIHDLSSLLKCFKESRCLVIFDQWETITIASKTGQYRPGYEDYGDLIDRVRQNHQSCVVILSRANLESPGAGHAVRSLKLEELRFPEDREFLQGLTGTELELQSFLQIYNNPLILKLAARSVMAILGGNVSPLVEDGVSTFGTDDVERIMSKEFKYLSVLEEKLIYWLAIWQNPVSYGCIAKSLNVGFADFLSTLESLTLKRSLVNVRTDEDAGEREFGLDRMTLKYVTQEFVRRNVKELLAAIQNQGIQANDLIVSHAFGMGNDPELHQQQQRRIVRPIVEKLRESHRPDKLRQALEVLRSSAPAGYAVDNIDRLLTLYSPAETT